MASKRKSIVDELVSAAIRLGLSTLDIEHKEGYEQVFAVSGGGIGCGIARLPSSSREAARLRAELYGLAKKKRRVRIGDWEYELRSRVYESFGEDAFRVDVRRVRQQG